ncbi:GNAT family N-acetyltransferase [Staphylococcus haemolyticus]|uniref:GNAT family N-acetyltransferase n=1 Tax=Staphylococcus haemolyticus TaxID=1283 RepID=UPI00069CCCFF|nr:GNAT family N-acetyltransferase [Staphylococcus haemolyticus]UOD89504.1 GNAT family N-acetyltransferase [Staphylococcus haemolyticus]
MTNIRILKHDDLDHYTQLLSSNTHTYSWDKVYLENISNNDLKQMLSDDDEFCNIIGAFKDDKLVACVTLRQLRQVGSSHKAMIENLFLLDKKDESTILNLMQFAIDYAKSRNIEKLMTCVTSNNISGKIFFSSMGLETLGLESKSSKIGDEYFDVHWLLYDIV